MRVERNADPADGQRPVPRRFRQIAVPLEVDRGRNDLDMAGAGLPRAARQIVVAGDHRVRDAHHGVDLVAKQRARPMILIAVKPGIVIVDDVRQTFEARDFQPGRKPRQRFLLEPDEIVVQAPPQRREAPPVRADDASSADPRPAIERSHIGIVEQRPHVERKAFALQRRQELQEADAAARAEAFVTCEHENVGHASTQPQ